MPRRRGDEPLVVALLARIQVAIELEVEAVGEEALEKKKGVGG